MSRAEFTENGRWALLATYNSPIRVWDLSNRIVFEPVPAAAFRGSPKLSPDGGMLAYGTPENAIALCDPRTGKVRTLLKGHEETIHMVEFNREGTRLASTAGDRTIRIWDASSGLQIACNKGSSGSVILDPNLRFAALADDQSAVRLLELETGRELAKLPMTSSGYLFSVFSPSGDRVATAEGFPNNIIRIWETRSGRLLAVLRGHENQLYRLRFSSDGTKLASCSRDRTIRIARSTSCNGAGWPNSCRRFLRTKLVTPR